MYHVELRQFPHNHSRFNLTEGQLRALTVPWAQEQVVEMGERKWSPLQANLTVLEGPEIPLQQLSMGRGWRTAQRQGEDVTEQVLADARRAAQVATATTSAAVSTGALADPLALGVQLASLLGADPGRLLAAWRDVAAAHPGLAPSESLALAEHQIAAAGNQD